jgi:signal transduction histidine kinase
MMNEGKKLKTGFQVITVILTLLVFGGAIWGAKEQMSERIRGQVLARYAQELYAISLVHQVIMAESGEALFLEDAATQLAVCEAVAELTGAMGLRLYTPEGEFFISSPENIIDGTIEAGQVDEARMLSLSSGLNEDLPVEDIFWEPLLEADSETSTLAVREVLLPVHVADEDELLGIAQFIYDGDDSVTDIAGLNDGLFRQSFFVFIVGGAVVTVLLSVSFIRMNRVQHALARRTFALKKVNQELALSDRTSAVGGMTSHLIHGLRNPLAGLSAYLKGDQTDSGELFSAKSAIERMEGMIDNIVRTLGENTSGLVYEVSVAELLEIFSSRMVSFAVDHQVQLSVQDRGGRELNNRECNLILLILENLTQNAVEACEKGSKVDVTASKTGEATMFEVSDNGSGLQEPVKESLFQPGNTTKEQGSGLGLAISGQLAVSMSAELSLVKSNESGTTFRLTLAERDPD